jgi:DNA-binding response OmpR family regulator
MTSAKKIMVLVVDDDPSMVELLEHCLKSAEYQVVTAVNGIEGLEAAIKEKPELLILDLLMPGMHGFDVCQKLREEATLKGMKILISSGKGYAVDIKAAKRLGADDYIVKPYEIDQLLTKVRELVGKP